MCGIVGYIGNRQAAPILLQSLSRLEYRGYDSAGIATLLGDRLSIRKKAGPVSVLQEELLKDPVKGTVGICHTRWATHGPPTDVNAHPHSGGNSVVALVHNGVIENYSILKKKLIDEGYRFQSETDTEVIAHLIASQISKSQKSTSLAPADFRLAVQQAVSQLRGTFGLAVISPLCPGAMIVARHGSPVVLGIGKGENFVASDQLALIQQTDRVVFLNDGEIALVTADRYEISRADNGKTGGEVVAITASTNDVEKGDYPHFMLKEIFEQPQSIENTLRGRLDSENNTAVLGGLNLSPQELGQVRRIILTGCGSSWHAALVGEYLIEEIAKIPVEVEYASELRYRNPPIEAGTIAIAIAQSGETADTLATVKEMKRKGIPTLGIVNVVGSSIAREADGGIYLHAGPEIGVASTKAFTSQLVALTMLALYLGRMRHLSPEVGHRIISDLKKLPELVKEVLQKDGQIRQIAKKYAEAKGFLYLGRTFDFPIALEGALKLKETSYLHAQGYPAAEMKHGPIALIDKHVPSVVIVPSGTISEKVMAGVEEIKARSGPIIAIAPSTNTEIAKKADDVIYIPETSNSLRPVLCAVVLQLFAYHMAVLKGCNVDKPRNLAKSVTVE